VSCPTGRRLARGPSSCNGRVGMRRSSLSAELGFQPRMQPLRRSRPYGKVWRTRRLPPALCRDDQRSPRPSRGTPFIGTRARGRARPTLRLPPTAGSAPWPRLAARRPSPAGWRCRQSVCRVAVGAEVGQDTRGVRRAGGHAQLTRLADGHARRVLAPVGRGVRRDADPGDVGRHLAFIKGFVVEQIGSPDSLAVDLD
jgi:hypothetical protein